MSASISIDGGAVGSAAGSEVAWLNRVPHAVGRLFVAIQFEVTNVNERSPLRSRIALANSAAVKGLPPSAVALSSTASIVDVTVAEGLPDINGLGPDERWRLAGAAINDTASAVAFGSPSAASAGRIDPMHVAAGNAIATLRLKRINQGEGIPFCIESLRLRSS
jgi:hypothetical protein